METMNYDTVLPPRVRAELSRPRKPKRPKRLKLWHKIAIGLILLIGLRHLNTVPQRERVATWYTEELVNPADPPPPGAYIDLRPKHQVKHSNRVYTSEELFGSIYRQQIDGIDTGSKSKLWNDFYCGR
jgi:hypothetical protein